MNNQYEYEHHNYVNSEPVQIVCPRHIPDTVLPIPDAVLPDPGIVGLDLGNQYELPVYQNQNENIELHCPHHH